MTQEELRERAEPHVKRAFEEQREALQGCADRGETQALWVTWSRALDRALLRALPLNEGSRGDYAWKQGRGIMNIKLRNVGPPTPRWGEGKGSVEELLQSYGGAHAKKVGRTLTAIRNRLRKAPWSDWMATEPLRGHGPDAQGMGQRDLPWRPSFGGALPPHGQA